MNVDRSFRYVAGPAILRLGNSITHEAGLRQICSPHLDRLATETRQTVQLGTLFGFRVLYVDQVRTPAGGDLFIEPTGTPFEVNISAGGKVMVAGLAPELRREFLDHADLRKATDRSIVDRDVFERELDQTRAKGYTLDDSRLAVGVRCFAAPLIDAEGSCVASLGVTGHLISVPAD